MSKTGNGTMTGSPIGRFGKLLYVPLEVAASPADGRAMTDSWWSVHPEKGLAFYYTPADARAMDGEPAPQCNRDERVARKITDRLYPEHEVRHVPVVFLAHARKAMRAERKAS
jgi:hypothetical protein